MTAVGRLARTGLRKGLFEGSRPWLYTGIAAVAVRVLARFREKDQTVYSGELKAGQRLEIRVIPPDAR
ncbi:MAG: hypothetical protein H0V95_03110 [Actinobacteria bacterium]|nr:hypothetical protein [Actinomycetota bacterium]